MAQFTTGRDAVLLTCILIAVPVLTFVLYMVFRDTAPPVSVTDAVTRSTASVAVSPNRSPTHQANGGSYITVDGLFGCAEAEEVARLSTYYGQGERALYLRELDKGVRAGRCVMFRKDDPVFVMRSAPPVVKVRREGGTKEYWVFDAIVE